MSPLKFLIQIINEIPITLYGDGSIKRDFTYISDIINGIYLAFKKVSGYNIFNIGANYPHSISELIQTIEKVTGNIAEIKYQSNQLGDVDLTFADISKAKDILGYQPKVNLESGIKIMFQWYMDLDNDYKNLLINEIKK